MFDRIRNIFKRGEKRSDSAKDDGGKIYALCMMILPIAFGFVSGGVLCAGLGYALDVFAGNDGMRNQAVSFQSGTTDSGPARRNLDGFLATNPFRISPRPTNTPPPAPEKAPEPPKEEPDTFLDDIILRGTLPGVGAFIEMKNSLKTLLVGRELEKYKLISVTAREAVFRKGNDKPVKKYIVYGPVAEAKKPEPAKQTAPAPKPAPAQPQTGNIVAAVPDKQEGQISSEMVNQLVQNPFDELKRIRMRPNEKAGGLEVQWIQNDSLLKRLGVQRGDVIRSVNGIPFTNMGDIANSINSLMNSERFDVEVTRGGNNTALRYVVK